MSRPDTWVGARDEYLSAVECRVRLGRAFTDAEKSGDHVTGEQIYPALLEARGAEEQCRIALQHATADVVNLFERAA